MSSTVSTDQILAYITKMQEGFENRFAAQDQRMKALEEDISALKDGAQAVELAKEQITRYIDSAQNQLAETCRAIQDANSKKVYNCLLFVCIWIVYELYVCSYLYVCLIRVYLNYWRILKYS